MSLNREQWKLMFSELRLIERTISVPLKDIKKTDKERILRLTASIKDKIELVMGQLREQDEN